MQAYMRMPVQDRDTPDTLPYSLPSSGSSNPLRRLANQHTAVTDASTRKHKHMEESILFSAGVEMGCAKLYMPPSLPELLLCSKAMAVHGREHRLSVNRPSR